MNINFTSMKKFVYIFFVIIIIECFSCFGRNTLEFDKSNNITDHWELNYEECSKGLFPGCDPVLTAPRLKSFVEQGDSSRDVVSASVSNEGNSITITTTEYGEVERLLEENEGNKANEIIVSGPIDENDIYALWMCAMQENLRILDLQNTQIKNKTIPDNAFCKEEQLENFKRSEIIKIILPDDIETIGSAAFALTSLEEINIPKALKKLGSFAFYNTFINCPIIIPEGVEKIEPYTFATCQSLAIAPVLPSSLKSIGKLAFFFNIGLESIELNEGLEVIDFRAFDWTGLKEIKIPNSVIEIGEKSFKSNINLEKVEIPGSLKEIPDEAFIECHALKEVNLPEGIIKIGAKAFSICLSLKTVNLPESCETIGEQVFVHTEIESIVLPSRLKLLSESCFGTESLKMVYSKAEVPPLCQGASGPFRLANLSDLILYVPVGCKEAYKSQWQWSEFKEIVETDQFPSASVTDTYFDMNRMQRSNIYDLSGKRINAPIYGQPYIQNGKKKISQH